MVRRAPPVQRVQLALLVLKGLLVQRVRQDLPAHRVRQARQGLLALQGRKGQRVQWGLPASMARPY